MPLCRNHPGGAGVFGGAVGVSGLLAAARQNLGAFQLQLRFIVAKAAQKRVCALAGLLNGKRYLQRVKGREMPWPEDRTARHQEFNALLARRDQEEMLLMLRCIYARRRSLKKAGKHLPGMDDDIMHSCEKLLTQEFSLCLQIPPAEVGEYLHNALDGDPC